MYIYSNFHLLLRSNTKHMQAHITYLAEILLKTAVKLFWLSANRTLEAKFFSCRTSGFGLSVGWFRNYKKIITKTSVRWTNQSQITLMNRFNIKEHVTCPTWLWTLANEHQDTVALLSEFVSCPITNDRQDYSRHQVSIKLTCDDLAN